MKIAKIKDEAYMCVRLKGLSEWFADWLTSSDVATTCEGTKLIDTVDDFLEKLIDNSLKMQCQLLFISLFDRDKAYVLSQKVDKIFEEYFKLCNGIREVVEGIINDVVKNESRNIQ